jgi:anionic cell wall polymer biosynthesis LytR-Cps2A-Psr (LCP) family protein
LILIISGLLGASILSATAGALLALSLSSTPLLQSSLSPEEAAIFEQNGDLIDPGLRFSLPRLTRPVNILLLGTKVLTSDVYDPVLASQDLGYHALVNSFEGLSDTMLLIRFDPVQEQVSVLSIPRDTRAYVDGVGLTKINEANLLGGPALSAQAVSELLNGVPIDRYLRVNVQGVEALIDALGGSRSMYPRI